MLLFRFAGNTTWKLCSLREPWTCAAVAAAACRTLPVNNAVYSPTSTLQERILRCPHQWKREHISIMAKLELVAWESMATMYSEYLWVCCSPNSHTLAAHANTHIYTHILFPLSVMSLQMNSVHEQNNTITIMHPERSACRCKNRMKRDVENATRCKVEKRLGQGSSGVAVRVRRRSDHFSESR